MISNIGFVGAGKVGTSLGKYFAENKVVLSGYYSQTKSNSVESADFTNSTSFDNIEDLVNISNTIFLTVPDDQIGKIWSQIKDVDIKEKNIIHCSGALSSTVFEGVKDRGAYAFSLHPLFSINSKTDSWKDLKNAYFTIEGDTNGHSDPMDEIKELIANLGNPIVQISAESKIKYHAASVFVSNLVVGLAKEGQELFASCGLDDDFSNNAWKSLFIGNANNIVNSGLDEALTGPVERADYDTIKKHLNNLEGRDEVVYRELSRMILEIAKGKHPERDYTEIDKEL